MKKYFTRILALVCCLAASLTASAQYSKVVEQYPRSNYDTDAVEFNLTEVATALGTDTATLVGLLENVSPDLFYLEGATAGYNCSPNGYWMDKDAVKTDWGDAAFWYVSAETDQPADKFILNVGQFPGHFEGGEETTVAHFILAMGDKRVTFDIALKIKAIDISTDPVLLSQLDVIQHKSVEVHQWARTSTYSEADTLDFQGVAAALGISPELFSVGLSRVVFATKVREDDGLGLLGDTLTNLPTRDAPGWWFDTTNDTPIFSKFVAKNDGVFFVDAFQFNPETEELIFNVGQKGGALPIDGSDQGMGTINEVCTTIYFVYEGKAIDLNVKLIIDERDKVPFSEMIEIGSEDVNLSQYPTTDYSSVSFSLDLDAIAALLEVDPTEITLWAAIADDISDEETATKGGFWFNKEGYSATYGSNSGIYVEPDVAGVFSKFQVGQYPNAFSGGEEAIATIYLVAGSKYYKVNITMEILTKEGPGVEFQSVASRAVKIQIMPANNYDVEMGYNIDPADLELIGTDNPALYAQKAPTEGTEWVDGEYSDSYSCTPHPGFWMSKEGFASSWGSSPWGFTYSNDNLYYTFYQMPNQNQVGDEYNAVIYLVNEQNGKMITYNFNIKFVSNVIPQAEVVGQESLMLPVATTGMTATPVDVKNALEKIGLTEAAQLFGIQSVTAADADGNMSEPFSPSGGLWITEEGAIGQADGSDAAVGVELSNNGATEILFNIFSMLPSWETDKRINSRIGLQNEGKIYIFNMAFVSEEVYTAIHDAKKDNNEAATFDLSGRRVEHAQRGVYIQDGRKVVVK